MQGASQNSIFCTVEVNLLGFLFKEERLHSVTNDKVLIFVLFQFFIFIREIWAVGDYWGGNGLHS